MTRALQVVVDPDDFDEIDEGEMSQALAVVSVDDPQILGDGQDEHVVRRVSRELSPFIHAFYNHFPCKILIREQHHLWSPSLSLNAQVRSFFPLLTELYS